MKILLALVLTACGLPNPPTHYSIDPTFDAEQADSIRRASAEWCDAVEYCPEEVSWPSAARVVYRKDLARYEKGREINSYAVHVGTDGLEGWVYGDILCDMSDEAMQNENLFHSVILHEWGHHGNTEHTESGLMSWAITFDHVYYVDDLAISNWCNGVGCE